ncbi:MAG: oxidoreductase [Pedobacter sp.]|nr:MAG: oxidoreductase [Pedobacter sp.]
MRTLLLLMLLFPLFAHSQEYQFKVLNSSQNTSIRGMCIVSDQVAWVSGSNGSIGKTLDGGITWQWNKAEGYEKLDFRDIEAFDENKAIVVNAGSPAYILLTIDGGKTWSERYKNLDSAIFLDGMSFWDEKNGMAFGDPINNKMQLIRTNNGGLTWEDVSGQMKEELKVGEAGFAASGTTIVTKNPGRAWIATGGSVANIYYTQNHGFKWFVKPLPILQGESSTGPFSMAFYDRKNGVVVGGNYLKDQESTNNVLWTADGGKTWRKSKKPVSGYRSCLTYLNKKMLVATGSSGTDLSKDGGKNWQNISSLNFNVVQKSKTGNLILLAGGKGEIYQLIISH